MKEIKPKGILIPIGGHEDKSDKKEILCRLVEETKKRSPKACIITVASEAPDELVKEYRAAFRPLTYSVSFIHFNDREKADARENMDKAKNCDFILFSGGNQLKLSSLLGGSELLALIKTRYYDEPNFVVAGTSAGAAAMSNTIVISGTSQDALIMGELGLTNGLDFINSVFIDTHFVERGRFGRLIQTVACNPAILGVGLGEDTAIVIKRADEMEVIGSGLVIVVDGLYIEYTNLTETGSGEPITIEGIHLHVIGPHKTFLIGARKIKKTAKKKKS
jgi:cyanophycinase